MGTTLNGTTPQNTYPSLIKVGDNGPLSATAKVLSDGEGNDSILALSTTAVGIGTNAPTGLLNVQNSTNGALLARFKDNISAQTYLDIKTDPTLTDYTALYFGADRRMMSKQGGALFLTLSNSINLIDGLSSKVIFTPTEVQIGTITGARLGIKGSGTTNATTALLVQNSAGTNLFNVRDDGGTSINGALSVSNISTTFVSIPSGGLIVGNSNPRLYQFNATNANLSVNSTGIVASTSGYSSSTASAVLEATSTTQGFLPPRMTTAQRDAIVTPATGLRIYNTTTNTNDTYNGTTWQSNSVSGVAGAIQFSDGSAFASDAANFFWNNTTKRLGIGTNTPTTSLDVNGSIRAGINLTVVGEIQNPTVGVVNINGELRVASPNVSIGLTSYPARLAVRGSGSTFATKALLIQNSSGTNLLEVLDSGSCIVAGLTSNGSVAAQRFFVQGAAFPFSLPFAFDAGATSTANTSGVRDAYRGSFSYLPTSGNGELNIFNASPTINQTGGANGITRGLYINPTLTAAADFRAIEASNGGAYINTTSVQASAILQADSTTKGFLPPRMTTTQKNAIASPAEGLVVMDITTHKLCVYDGTSWVDLH
jgi:hypothetical protein